MKKVLSIATVLLLVLALFAGCGKTEPQELTVKDQKNSVSATFEKGMTVADLLAQIGVVVNEKDEITPALDTVLEEPVEVSIARYAKVNVKVVDAAAKAEEDSELADSELTDGEEAATEAEEPTTEAAAEEKVFEVELVGATVADALEKAGIKVDETVSVNFDLTAYLSDIDGDIIVTLNANTAAAGEEESATAAEEATTEEATTEEKTTAASSDDDDDDYYYEDDDNDYEEDDNDNDNYYNNYYEPTSIQMTTNAPITEPSYAPDVNDGLNPDNGNQGGNQGGSWGDSDSQGGSSSGDRVLERTEWVNDCDGSGGGYVIYWYSDGSYETEMFDSRPGGV